MSDFKVGDRVKCAFYGDEIFTLETFQFSDGLIIKHGDNYVPFLADGKVHKSHTHPVLTLVERAKVKVEVTAWANIYDGWGSLYYPSKESADKNQQPGRTACVELVGEREMTLEEIVKALPEGHKAREEWKQLMKDLLVPRVLKIGWGVDKWESYEEAIEMRQELGEPL